MKTLKPVITTLICTVFLFTSAQAQQSMTNATDPGSVGFGFLEASDLPDLSFSSTITSFGITTQGDLEDLILEKMAEKHIPGLSAVLLKDFKVAWSGHFGYADIDLGKPVTEDTLFHIASISKTVTATALMQLWEQGLFELDDPINDYLPFTVAHPDYPNTDITFFMILTHTASFSGGLGPGITWGGDCPIPLGYFLEEHFTPGGIYYSLANFNSWEPGTQWAYTDVSIALAGYLVEVISGIELEPYCQEHIFTPLKMDNTSFFLANLDPSDIAVPYKWQGGTYQAYQHYGLVCYPSSQVRTSAHHLACFLSAFMKNAQVNKPPYNGGNPGSNFSGNLMNHYNSSPSFFKYNNDPPFMPQLLESDTIEMILTPYFSYGTYKHQGLVWRYYNYDWLTHPIWGHSGSYKGTSTEMWYAPEKEVGVVVLTNGEAGIFDICAAIFSYGYEL
jgi:CubicO group peptidase (beta-lactamase class C family)